jgi:hypothetical protein
MDSELLKTVGQIAGLGGFALGVFLLLFQEVIRKAIFPTLKKDHAYRLLRLMVLLVSGVALAGIGTWAWVETRPGTGDVTQRIQSEGDIHARDIIQQIDDSGSPVGDTRR